MKHQHIIYKVFALFLMLFVFGGRDVQAATNNTPLVELNDKYVTIGNSTTKIISGWYVIYITSNNSKYFLTDNQGSALVSNTFSSNGIATSLGADGMAGKLFYIEGNANSFTMRSGYGNYVTISVTATNSSTIGLDKSSSNATRLTFTGGNRIRTNATTTVSYRDYYGYLMLTTSGISGGASTSDNSKGTVLTLAPVTLTEKHYVTYHYVYDSNSDGDYDDAGDEKVDVQSSGPLALQDNLPAVALPASLDSKNFELDPTDAGNRPSGRLTSFSTLEWNIKVQPKATAKPQTITVPQSPIEMFISSQLDVSAYVSSDAVGITPTYTCRITNDGGTGATMTGSVIHSGATEGSITVGVKANAHGSNANPETWYAASAEKTITVKISSVPTYILNFQTAFARLAAFTDKIGSTLGKYTLNATVGSVNYDNNAYLTAVAEYGLMNKNVKNQTEAALNAATERMNAIVDVINTKDGSNYYQYLTLNMPVPGTLLRLQECNHVGYYYTATDNNNGQQLMNTQLAQKTASADNIFYYYNTGTEVSPNNVFLSYRNGLYLAKPIPASGKLAALAAQGTAPAPFTIADADRTVLGGYYALASNGAIEGRYVLEEVTELPVAITSYGWATLYTPTPLTIPSNLMAYVETAAPADGRLPVTRILGTVPAGTALILRGAEGVYDFVVQQPLETVNGQPEETPNVVLTGSYPLVATSSVDSQVYTLQPLSSGTGFYPWTKQNITHFRAYHRANAGSPVKGFVLVFEGEETDAVLTPDAAHHEAEAVYNLQGHCLGTDIQHLPHGLYIVNGKKVIK